MKLSKNSTCNNRNNGLFRKKVTRKKCKTCTLKAIKHCWMKIKKSYMNGKTSVSMDQKTTSRCQCSTKWLTSATYSLWKTQLHNILGEIEIRFLKLLWKCKVSRLAKINLKIKKRPNLLLSFIRTLCNCSYFENTVRQFPQMLNRIILWSRNFILVIYPREMKMHVSIRTCT